RGESADEWLDTSVALALRLASAWDVTPEAILEGGAMSVVVLCRDRTGTATVLKVPGTRDMGVAESTALASWKNGALPGVLATDPDTGSFLMEFIPSIKQAPSPAGITGLLERLHVAPVTGTARLEAVLDGRIEAAALRFASENRASEREHLAVATAMMEALQRTAKPTMVHGDFQAKNVLTGESGPVAIDPLPAVGDPVSDLGLWIAGGSAGPRSAAIRHYAGASSDPERLLAWAWALAVLEYRPGSNSADAARFVEDNRGPAVDAAAACMRPVAAFAA
ncbi:MAG TPA: aminoglycoside phosphotransferase family protein, partial [Arthrobacter sp.]